MENIESKSINELSKRLIEIKKEEQAIMLELWKRCDKVDKPPFERKKVK